MRCVIADVDRFRSRNMFGQKQSKGVNLANDQVRKKDRVFNYFYRASFTHLNPNHFAPRMVSSGDHLNAVDTYAPLFK